MEITTSQLEENYKALSTDELIELSSQGYLSDQAKPILEKELSSRGVSILKSNQEKKQIANGDISSIIRNKPDSDGHPQKIISDRVLMNTQDARRFFYIIHSIIFLIFAALFLMLASSGGHPPGIIFAPFLIVGWLCSHAIIAFSHKLSVKGKFTDGVNNISKNSGISVFLIIFLVLGFFLILGIFATLMFLIGGNATTAKRILLAEIPTIIIYLGILLRLPWSRLLAGALFILLAITKINSLIRALSMNKMYMDISLYTVPVEFITLILIALYCFYSRSFKEYFFKCVQ